jgi:hypothetical protein
MIISVKPYPATTVSIVQGNVAARLDRCPNSASNEQSEPDKARERLGDKPRGAQVVTVHLASG